MTVYCLICGAEYTSSEAISSHAKGTNWGVCPSCLADARLGRLVRGFHMGLQLIRGEEDWYAVENKVWDDDVRGRGATPEEALEKAGVKG